VHDAALPHRVRDLPAGLDEVVRPRDDQVPAVRGVLLLRHRDAGRDDVIDERAGRCAGRSDRDGGRTPQGVQPLERWHHPVRARAAVDDFQVRAAVLPQ
jgi:hypothetical protein